MSEVWRKTQRILRDSPTYRTMFHMMEQFPGDIAAEMTAPDGTMVTRTYKEYVEMTKAACEALRSCAGINNGSMTGFIYETCMDWPVIFWALLMSGTTPLLLNPVAPAKSLVSTMKEAGAKAYVSEKPVEGCDLIWINAADILGGNKAAPGAEPCEGSGAGCAPEAEAGACDAATASACEETWADTVALCTSGTTGKSRIFLYDGATIACHLLSFDEAKQKNEDMPFVEDIPTKLLAFLPFHHVFGFSVIYILYSCTGKTIVYLRDKAVQTIMGACQRHGVTHLYCIPMFFNALAGGIRKRIPDEALAVLPEEQKAAVRAQLLGTQMRSMITGGGHVPASTMKTINALGYPLYNGFGMTESGIISVEMSADPGQRMKGSIGTPFSVTEFRTEPEGAEVGEFLIRGDALYSASIIDGEIVPRDRSQWFSTGDLVRITEDGLFIEGRVKDVIINSSGENVYPDDLEDLFAELPGVQTLCILGLKKGEYEEISLIVNEAPAVDGTGPGGGSAAASDGGDSSPATATPATGPEAADPAARRKALSEAVNNVNKTLQTYTRVRKLYVSEKPLPVSGSMKVMRQILRTAIEAGQWPLEEIKIAGGEGMRKAGAAELKAGTCGRAVEGSLGQGGTNAPGSGAATSKGSGTPEGIPACATTASADGTPACATSAPADGTPACATTAPEGTPVPTCEAGAAASEEFLAIQNKIREILVTAFELDNADFENDANLVTDLGGDSITIFSAVCDVEDEFGIEIPEDSVKGLSSVRDMTDLVYGLIRQK